MSSLRAKLRNPRLPIKNVTRKRVTKVKALDLEVIKGDLTQEKTDAIMNINSTDMDMTKAGALSKAILIGGGLQLQQECSQLGQQTPGSVVMTSGGGLAVKHIIHIIPGIPLSPKNWAPMPRTETVHTVKLSPGSGEYQNVLQKVKATASGINIQKIERVQNPHLYQSYMVRKEKMDKDKKGTNEQQLFHGTNADNVAAINTQGFNRSLCGVHGTKFGQGVYFARDASYSVNYAGGKACGQMYLARVLVGQYCQGDPSMRVPPPKDPSRPEILYESVVDDIAKPSIFVVFYDNQCYPEYLITFS